MDCRETQELLAAFHDGELPATDRARVEGHLRGCPKCGALLSDLARADRAAGVPDPGPAYWDRFNARVMERVEREAEGPKVAVLRRKQGWMRQQFRYLVPAAAVAALVVGIVRYGEMAPALPPMARDGQVPGQAGTPRMSEPRPMARDGQVPGQAGMPRMSEPRPMARDGQVPGQAGTPRMSEPRPITDERFAGPSLGAGNEDASQDRATVPAPGSVRLMGRDDQVPGPAGMPFEMHAERKKMEETATAAREMQFAAKTESASRMKMEKSPSPTYTGPSPCEMARTLALRKRWREAEAAQRKCLEQDQTATAQEKGLLFLAELLDRQDRVAEADAVITEVERQFPESRPLDLYRQQRPMVQQRR